MGEKDDLIGQRFGKLVIKSRAPDIIKGKRKEKAYYCDCDCGTKNHIVSKSNLKSTKSCGCGRYLHLEGQRFGRLVVLYEKTERSKEGLKIYHCKCDCGKECEVIGSYLIHGDTKSCGCYKIETAKTSHIKYNKFDLTNDYGIGYTSKGEPFFFDLEDYDLIKDYCWGINSEGYVSAKAKDGTNKHILFHQLVFDKYVDHIGGKNTRNDNRKVNLRKNSSDYSFETYNNMNKGIQKNNTSGCPGVTWHKRDSLWEVRISVNKKQIYLGRYDDYNEAVKVRKEAENKYFKGFSYDNSQQYAKTIEIKEGKLDGNTIQEEPSQM